MSVEPDRTLNLIDLGLVPYRDCWELQKELQQKRIKSTISDTLIICEHPAVITFGRSSKPEQLLATPKILAKNGIEFFEIERGGAVTFHGPGQLIAYPILDLKNHKTDVNWYMRALEDVIILTLARYNIVGQRNPGFTGVWIENEQTQLKKIAAIGVRLSRWCSMHGLAINVKENLAGFKFIVPCGIENVEVTCVETQVNYINSNNTSSLPISMSDFKQTLVDDFLKVFNYNNYSKQSQN